MIAFRIVADKLPRNFKSCLLISFYCSGVTRNGFYKAEPDVHLPEEIIGLCNQSVRAVTLVLIEVFRNDYIQFNRVVYAADSL